MRMVDRDAWKKILAALIRIKEVRDKDLGPANNQGDLQNRNSMQE